MTLILSGTDGLSDVDGSAATPAIRGTDANTGIFFPAADTIAFSEGGVEAMRIDSSGNVGIGVTSPATRLDVSGVASTNQTARFLAKFADTSAVAQGNGGGIMFRGVYTGTTLVDAAGIQAYKANATDNNYSYGLAFTTRANGGDLTANMRLDENGNMGLGVTPSAWYTGYKAFQLTGDIGFASTGGALRFNNYLNTGASADIYYGNGWAGRYRFTVGNHIWDTAASGTAGGTVSFTSVMTLDSSGNLLVGTTSNIGSTPILTAVQPSVTNLAVIGAQASSASYAYNILDLNTNTASGTGFAFIKCRVSNYTTTVFQVLGNGNAQNANNSYGATSDIKVKENIVDASPKLADLLQVKIRNYNLKSDPAHKQIGVVAQELEEIFPSMIDELPDKDLEGNDLGTTTKAVKYSVFVPMLIKAIQEQQAIITALQADVAALKAPQGTP